MCMDYVEGYIDISPVMKFLLIISLYKQTTLTALGEMFEAARSIMSWLGDCAKVEKFGL